MQYTRLKLTWTTIEIAMVLCTLQAQRASAQGALSQGVAFAPEFSTAARLAATLPTADTRKVPSGALQGHTSDQELAPLEVGELHNLGLSPASGTALAEEVEHCQREL